jgi:hypothetical protein
MLVKECLSGVNPIEPANPKATTMRHSLLLLLSAALLVVSGCGFRWWYGQAGMLLERRINRYTDLSSEQRQFVRPRLTAHLEWHRAEAIPQHLAFLERTRDGIQDGVTGKEIQWFINEYQRQAHLLIGQLAPDAVQLLKTLTPTQIEHFERRLGEDNQEYEKQRSLSTEKRLEQRAERTIKELKDWLGSISSEQEEAITHLSRELPDNFDRWYQERLDRQHGFIDTLRNRGDDRDIEAAFFRLMRIGDPDQPETPPPAMVKMVLAVDRLATPKQRQNVVDKLQSWIDELKYAYERR